jgi:hypothetical protein
MAINEKKAYAAYYDNDIRMKSSSGAIFSLLANEVLEKKGIVYGVAMNASCTEAEYIGVTEKQDLEKLLGSKYLQAKIKNIFKNVRENLVLNKLVLFTGTGCQINGLKKFLQKDYKNLICVDIICHGVPSPALWKEYVGYMENKMQGKMEKVNFRCKDQGWENFGMKEYGSSKEVYISKSKDPYMQMFLSDFCLRPSCYECKAKTLRLSDLTIGDFWGIDTIAPEMNDSKFVKLIQKQFRRYEPKAVKRVEIPKPNGKMRPLGIPCIIDRIVQQCILQVMEPICEAKFYEHSYGFRPCRSAENAISYAYGLAQRNKLHYVVDVDVKGFFDG